MDGHRIQKIYIYIYLFIYEYIANKNQSEFCCLSEQSQSLVLSIGTVNNFQKMHSVALAQN